MTTATALLELVDEKNRIDPEIAWVLATNNGDTDFNFKYNSRDWIVRPGETRQINYFNAVMYLGDPRSFNHPTDDRQKFRAEEWKRLRTLYGIYEHEGDPEFMCNLPNITITNTAGERILMVVDDPHGTLETAEIPTGNTTIAEMEARMEVMRIAMEKQAKQMEALLSANNPQPTIPDNDHRTEEPLVAPVRDDEPDTDIPVMSAEELTATSIPTQKAGRKA